MGCRRKVAVTELVRVVRREDGSLAVGRDLPGRGAWLCRGSAPCVEAATHKGRWSRALRGPVREGAVEEVAGELAPGRDVGGWSERPAP